MLNGVRVVRARSLELLLEEVGGFAVEGSYALVFGRGDERAPGRLPISLPLEAIRLTFTGGRVLPLGFPLVAIEDGPDRFLTYSVTRRDVEKLIIFGLLHPSLWIRDSQVVPERNTLMTTASATSSRALHCLDKCWMYSRRDSSCLCLQLLRSQGLPGCSYVP